MLLWLLIHKLNKPHPSGNRYSLALFDPDPKSLGICKTLKYRFPTRGAVIRFLVTSCKPEEVHISELESQLKERGGHAMKISKESALRIGFKF
jgi:hypothetical protein